MPARSLIKKAFDPLSTVVQFSVPVLEALARRNSCGSAASCDIAAASSDQYEISQIYHVRGESSTSSPGVMHEAEDMDLFAPFGPMIIDTRLVPAYEDDLELDLELQRSWDVASDTDDEMDQNYADDPDAPFEENYLVGLSHDEVLSPKQVPAVETHALSTPAPTQMLTSKSPEQVQHDRSHAVERLRMVLRHLGGSTYRSRQSTVDI
ncbi:hypothetical protein BC832DRAFT_593120 [Gaertneriomyces semiglobifer]|nr:hypothetical protein BC832DRAFT_593120 [Gaertneriomyces semiglobifer]